MTPAGRAGEAAAGDREGARIARVPGGAEARGGPARAPARVIGADHGEVSRVIPAFNETARLGRNLDVILSFLRGQGPSWEVIVVDDGSSDGTAGLVEARYGAEAAVRLWRHARNEGKGLAVKQGVLMARGAWVFFSDADLSVPIDALPVFLEALATRRCDVVVGSRQRPGAVIEVWQPTYRRLLGGGYSWLARTLLGLPVSDVTCGFKGFRRDVARDLFARQQLRDWSFDAEILYLARSRGYRILELPVRWRDDPASKVRLRRDIVRSLWGLVRIRVHGWLGRY
jgi:dolichyl-phosphate beta-glucosyltransferase